SVPITRWKRTGSTRGAWSGPAARRTPARASPPSSRSGPRGSRSGPVPTCRRSTPGGRKGRSEPGPSVSARRPDGTAPLCLVVRPNPSSIGCFGPRLPEIGRSQALADWQLGVLAGAFGFARMIADVPAGALAGRRLGTSLVLSPVVLLAGILLLGSAGPFPV